MEREAESVRLMDAGRLKAAYSSPLSTACFETVASDKYQVVAHGNQYGLTFLASESGFTVTTHAQYAAGCGDYVSRKQTAIDHGHNASRIDVESLTTHVVVCLPAIAYHLSLSPDELHLAVAYKDQLALFETAALLQSATPAAYHTFTDLVVEEIAWSPVQSDGGEYRLAVVTHTKAVIICSTDGTKENVPLPLGATSVAWSPTGESIAIGTDAASVEIFSASPLVAERNIERPACCGDGSEAHHINWAEEDVIFVGYKQYDADQEETTALACLFQGGECVELDELVAFYDMEGRKHQYYSLYLVDWQMFFVGCSLSTDVELLVFDPDSGEWQIWKPAEKYQARLPMTADDDETYPLGLTLNLNSQSDLVLDEGRYPPAVAVSAATTDGLLVNFSFVDLSVSDVLPFVRPPEAFTAKPTRAQPPPTPVPVQPAVSAKPAARATTSDVENVMADEDSDDGDLEEDKEEERETARTAFAEIDAASSGVIDKSRFADLLEAIGTTYYEPTHAKIANRLADGVGLISKEDFVEWYVGFVFGDNDEAEEDEAPAESSAAAVGGVVNALAKFAPKAGAWKCSVCLVSNDDAGAARCISCESPNPQFKGTSTPFGAVASTATTSKFSFGIPAGTVVAAPAAGSFGFGEVSKPMETASASGTSGWSFGFAAKKDDDATAANTPAASGFREEPMIGSPPLGFKKRDRRTIEEIQRDILELRSREKAAAEEKKQATGYGKNDEIQRDILEQLDILERRLRERATAADYRENGEIQRGILEQLDILERRSQEKAIATAEEKKQATGYGKNDENEFCPSGGDDTDDEEERKEEEEKARNAFRKVSPDEDSVPKDTFPKLFKALGSTYDEDEHGKTAESLAKNGVIHVDDFAKWYVSWIFDDGDSSDDDDDDAPPPVKAEASMKSTAEIQAAFSKYIPKEGSWKCDTCMVTNPDKDAATCLSCESPNPNAPKGSSQPAGAAASSTTAGAIGPGGFSFPTAAATKTETTGFSFGFGGSTTVAAAAPSFGGGFSFGGGNTSGLSFGKPGTTATATTGFTFTKSEDSTTPVKTEASSGYPPSTVNRPAPPPPPGVSPPKPAAATAPSSAYPPSTINRPAPPPPPGVATPTPAASAYPPSTINKPAPPPPPGVTPAKPAAASAYPPSTINKPPPPPPPGATVSKPAVASAYPPSTINKPAPPPPPGVVASKPAVPSGYPPSTINKPAPPPPPGVVAPKAAASGYPPSTINKPAPPPPPGVSQPKPAANPFGAFGSVPQSGAATTTGSGFSFGSFGSALGGVEKKEEATKGFSFNATPSLFKQPAANNSPTTTATKSPFGIVPSASTTPAAPVTKPTPFAIAAGFGQTPKPATTAPPSVKAKEPANTPAIAASPPVPIRPGETIGAITLPTDTLFHDTVKLTRGTASSVLEAQLWKLICDFDRAFRRVNHTTSSLWSSNAKFLRSYRDQVKDLQSKVAAACKEVEALDHSRDAIEKDVLFVIGSDGDVHEQLEYGREILASFKNEKLKRLLEEQPLDQRSEDTRKMVQDKLAAVEAACDDLDKHITTSTSAASPNLIGVPSVGGGAAAISTAHLFRALKQTYESSKLQYNRVSQLAQELDGLSVADKKPHAGLSGLVPPPRAVVKTKDEMAAQILEADDRCHSVRRAFLALCNNVVTPRDVFTTPRRKAPTPSPPSPMDKAFSRLMPRTQVTVASPMSTKSPPASLSFKDTPVKSGSKLFALAEDKAAPKEAKSFISAPLKKETKSPVRLAPQRPSISSVGSDEGSGRSHADGPVAKKTLTFAEPPARSTGKRSPDVLSAKKTLSFADADSSSSVFAPKPKPSVNFQLPAKASTVDYKERLIAFYQEHNPAKVSDVDQTLKDFSGKEETLFKRLFTKYLPSSTDEDVQKFVRGGPVPKKPAAQPSAFAGFAPKSPGGPTAATSPFIKPAVSSPFGKSPFSLGGGASTAPAAPAAPVFGGFGGFGGQAAPTFGVPSQPVNPYKQRLIEFYQKHNPSKLGDVDTTLAKYKGQEEKLFQNLATKYKVSNTAQQQQQPSPFGAVPKSPAASPFGNANAFSSIGLGGGQQVNGFGTTSTLGGGFGKAAAAPSSSPFVTAPPEANAFRSIGFGGDQKPAFGTQAAAAAASPFGVASPSPFGVNYKEKLVQFYQQHNPEKLSTVDATLEKYKGQEAKLFQMLEQKYLHTPTAPVTSGGGAFGGAFGGGASPAPAFGGGASPAPAFGGGATAFGAPSALGGATGPPAFGAPSSLGGASPTPAFGASSALGGGGLGGGGGGFGAFAPAAPSAAPPGGGFSAFSAQPASFGSFATGNQGAGGFGTGGGGFGSGGGFGMR